MSYVVYDTTGLVLENQSFSEHDRFVTILTPDFGIMRVRAGGSSKPESKLKYSLDLLSYGKFSIVRGKVGWRLTNAQGLEQIKIIDKNKKEVVGRVLGLCLSLIPQDQEEEEIFNFIFDFLHTITEIPNTDTKILEIYTVYSVLEKLGYIEKNIHIGEWGDSKDYIVINKDILVSHINNAIKASHLV